MSRPGCLALLAASLLAIASSALPAAAQYVSSLSMESTPADEYPFVSMVLNKEAGPLCTGTLVGSRTVLTAASCVAAGGSQPEPDLVFVGMSNIFLDPFRRGAAEVVDGRRRPGDYEMHRVERVVVHPDFQADAPQQSSNLALVVLEKASRAKPVALPGAAYAYPGNGTAVMALGFGSRSGDGYWPQLHGDVLALLPQDECDGLQVAYGAAAFGSGPGAGQAQACTALSHNFRACAAGNLGAPLLPAGGGTAVQLGLLVSGFSCSTDPSVASASSPALYTWLPCHADWLEEQLAAAGE